MITEQRLSLGLIADRSRKQLDIDVFLRTTDGLEDLAERAVKCNYAPWSNRLIIIIIMAPNVMEPEGPHTLGND